MKIGVIFLIGICVLFSVGAYTLGENLPTVLSKIRTINTSASNHEQHLRKPSPEELPEPEVHIETEYYEIYGETDVQVASTMDHRVPCMDIKKTASCVDPFGPLDGGSGIRSQQTRVRSPRCKRRYGLSTPIRNGKIFVQLYRSFRKNGRHS